MIWLYIVAFTAAATILVSLATRPVGFMLALIQVLAFFALALGLFGWFAILQDQVFLWYIVAGGGIWLLVTVLRRAAAS
ncbi:hypothetical protein LG284_08565 [Citricoccus nitrophenolicus]